MSDIHNIAAQKQIGLVEEIYTRFKSGELLTEYDFQIMSEGKNYLLAVTHEGAEYNASETFERIEEMENWRLGPTLSQ